MTTGRPLSKVLPCPNKGSRSCLLNVLQLRDISLKYILCTQAMYKQFSAYIQLLYGLQFSLGNLSYVHSFELFICGHNAPYTSVHSCVRSWNF